MMHASKFAVPALVAIVSFASAGCRGGISPGAATAVAATAIEVASHVAEESNRSSEGASFSPAREFVPAPIVVWPKDTASAPPGFDLSATRRAFRDVDLSACGTGAGTSAHANVTLSAGGDVTNIVVDDPANLSPETIQCIGDHMGSAKTPPFSGPFLVAEISFVLPSRSALGD